MTACNENDTSTENKQEVAIEETRENIESGDYVASKSPLLKEKSTTVASEDLEVEAEIENITGDEAIQLLSQVDVDTLELDSTFEDYEFFYDNKCTDIDGIPVYCVKAYFLKDEKNVDSEKSDVEEADRVYYVTLDGNAMFKVDYKEENYTNLETGEVIEFPQMTNN